jgi:hypothetical protein
VAGWVLRTPAGWQVSRPHDERLAEVACVGPATAPCAVTVARRTDRGDYPEASVLGGGLVPGGPTASTCTSLRGEPEEWLLGGRDGDVTAGVHFRCRAPGRAAAHHAVQVWIPEDYRLAWTESTQDRTVMAVMRTLDLDPARQR